MKFTIFQESRVGGRRNNQDRLAHCYSRDALLMVVADGMGGHLHGEVAAQIAVQYLTETFRREARPRLADPFRFLADGLVNAHRAIQDYALAHRLAEIESPRTTCVCCVVQDSIAYWAHVGDSRLYLLRGGRILVRTRDHSRVQMLLDEGRITSVEATTHPLRNRVYSCLGGAATPQVDYSRKTPLAAGDMLALCTDGAWSPLGDEGLIAGLATADPMQAVPRLLDAAEARGGHGRDNLSLIAMCWGENYGEETAAVETLTMPLDTHSTQMQEFGRDRAPQEELSDDDIERAIDEIRNTIQKHSKQEPQ